MRKIIYLYIVFLGIVQMACTKEMPTLFDDVDTGINFDFEKPAEALLNIDFVDVNLRGKQDTVVEIPVTLSGYKADEDLKIKIRTETNPDYKDNVLEVELEDYYVIPRDSTGMDIRVKIKKPVTLQVGYAIDLVIDEEKSEMKWGIDTLCKCTLVVKEEYTKPNGWNNFADYYGEYSAEKHSFIQYTLKSSKFLVWNPDPSVYNLVLIESLRERNRNNEEIHLSFPIVPANAYTAPKAWNSECELYYGAFSGALYKLLYNAFDIEMVREEEFFSEKTETVLAERNKTLVRESLNAWGDLYANSFWGYNLDGLASPSRFAGYEYEFDRPACWEKYPCRAESGEYTGDGSSFGFIVDYYGEYSEEKFGFMVACMEVTTPLWELFPVQKTMDFANNIYGQKVLAGGEEKLQGQNRFFRQKLDEWNSLHPEAPKEFTFPIK